MSSLAPAVAALFLLVLPSFSHTCLPPHSTPTPQTLGPYCAALCAAEVFSSLAKPSLSAHSSQDYAYAQLSKGRGGRPGAVGKREGGRRQQEAAGEDDAAEAATPARPSKPHAMRLSGEQQKRCNTECVCLASLATLAVLGLLMRGRWASCAWLASNRACQSATQLRLSANLPSCPAEEEAEQREAAIVDEVMAQGFEVAGG